MKIELINDSILLKWEDNEEKNEIINALRPIIKSGITEVELWQHTFHIKGRIVK